MMNAFAYREVARVCRCGCGEEFFPTTIWQRYKDPRHKTEHYAIIRPTLPFATDTTEAEVRTILRAYLSEVPSLSGRRFHLRLPKGGGR